MYQQLYKRLAEGFLDGGRRSNTDCCTCRSGKQMVRNCKEATWKNRKLDQKPLERNKKEAIYKTKMQVQMAKTQSYPPELHQELKLTKRTNELK